MQLLSVQPMEIKIMRRYVSPAKRCNPIVPQFLTDNIVVAYIDMRHDARNSKDMTYTSARTLLAILRLSTALVRLYISLNLNFNNILYYFKARLRLSEVVERGDISEAMRLIEASKSIINKTQTRVKGLTREPVKSLNSSVMITFRSTK